MKLKTILLVQFLFLLTKVGYTQNLNGKYIYGMEHGNRVIDFKKGHFKDITIDGSFTKVGRGTFKLKDSLLLINYKRIKNIDSSIYTLKSSPGKDTVTRVALQLNYEDGTPAEALIAVFDNDNNRVATYPIDTLGKSSFTIDHRYDSLVLSIVGIPYYVTKIPVKLLKNRSTFIKAILKERRFAYMQPAKVIYIIEKNENGKLILKSGENNHHKMIWKKID